MELRGPVKYLTASILFGVVGISFTISEILKILSGKQSYLLILAAGMTLFSPIVFKLYKESKKTNSEPLEGKLLPLYVGYMFTWIGATFVQVGIVGILQDIEKFYIVTLLGFIFFVLGLPLLIASLRKLINPTEKNRARLAKAVKFVYITAAIVGLIPVLIIIIAMIYAGYYIGGSIALVVLIFIIWLFFKIKNK